MKIPCKSTWNKFGVLCVEGNIYLKKKIRWFIVLQIGFFVLMCVGVVYPIENINFSGKGVLFFSKFKIDQLLNQKSSTSEALHV